MYDVIVVVIICDEGFSVFEKVELHLQVPRSELKNSKIASEFFGAGDRPSCTREQRDSNC